MSTTILVIAADPLTRQLADAPDAPMVLVATDGLCGLDLLREQAPRVRAVVVDLDVPPLEGRLLCAQIRVLAPAVAVLPIVGRLDPIPFLTEIGCQPALVKPLALPLLAQRVRAAHAAAPPHVPPGLLQLLHEQASAAERQLRQAHAARRVVVLAASPITRAGIVRLLGTVAAVHEVASPAELRQVLVNRRVTALVVPAPKLPAVAALAATHAVPLVVLAASPAQGQAALQAGADAVVLETDPAASAQLIAVLEALATGQPLLPWASAQPATPLVPAAAAQVLAQAGLTPREQAVVWLAAQGWSDTAIAAQFTVDRATITAYWKRIRRKLGRERAAICAWVRAGFADDAAAERSVGM